MTESGVVANLHAKKVGGNTYWYLREIARVDGKPKMVLRPRPGHGRGDRGGDDRGGDDRGGGGALPDASSGVRGGRGRLINPAAVGCHRDHRRAWDATHAVTAGDLAQIERRVSAAMITRFDLDSCSVALDMTNFATFIDSTNPSASLAQRGKAKQKRADLRLVGLGLVITRDDGIPCCHIPTRVTGRTSPSSRRC